MEDGYNSVKISIKEIKELYAYFGDANLWR
jgi:hypothetical protein